MGELRAMIAKWRAQADRNLRWANDDLRSGRSEQWQIEKLYTTEQILKACADELERALDARGSELHRWLENDGAEVKLTDFTCPTCGHGDSDFCGELASEENR